MARLVIIKNPFQAWNGRQVKTIPNGFTIRQAVDMAGFNGVEINCVVDDGLCVNDDYVLQENNLVTISAVVGKGGGKKIFAIIAMVALAVVAGGIAGGTMFKAGVGAVAKAWGVSTALAGSIIGATVMFTGSLLLGRYMGQSTDLGNYSYENDATYSWNGVQTMEGQNNAISLTYGTVKSGGQTIGKYVNAENNEEYLNWLVSAGEGPLAFSNIKINDNNIEYYDDVTYETREGINNQSVISNFKDTYFTKSLAYQLLDEEIIDTCQGNATEGIKIKLDCSNGLYYGNDAGGLDTAWVDVVCYYSGNNGTTWIAFAGERISGSQTSAIIREYRVDNLQAGTYKVKCCVTGRSHSVTNSRASTRCYWTELTSIVYDDFCYPNTALISIKAKATDQLSGTPSLSFLKTRSKVWVFNPYNNSYEQKEADNPAWASYDLIHQASRLVNIHNNNYEFDVRGVPARCMIYEQFKEWADFCDDYDLKVNIEINSSGEMINVVNEKIANCGRGQVIRFGTKYGAIWQCAKQPVQMFGMGNIISGTFNEEFLQTSDRANCVEITYNDKDNDYNRETITIYSDNYDTDAEEKTAQATFDGITSYSQAYREGMFQLYCNKYQLRTVSFDANIDSIACTIGDVILVSHDIPKWAKSGRILKVDIEQNDLVLPIESVEENRNYRIMYRTVNDEMFTSAVTIKSNKDGEVIVHCALQFDNTNTPQVNDIFDLAITEIGSKPFIVKAITRAQDFTRTITCIEYNENIYSENYNVPIVEYSNFSDKPLNVTCLVANRYKYTLDTAQYQYRLEIKWNITSSGTYDIYVSYDGISYNILASGVAGNSYVCNTNEAINYVKVYTKYKLYNSSGVVVPIAELSFSAKPNIISNVDITFTKTVNISWSEVTNAEVVRYEVRLDENPGVDNKYLLLRTSQLNGNIELTSRSGKLYLYAMSYAGKWSDAKELTYNQSKPSAPTITVENVLYNLVVKTNSLPSGIYGIKVNLEGASHSYEQIIENNNSATFNVEADIYSVKSCFLDYFGEGNIGVYDNDVTVKAYIDTSLIESESISVDKLSQTTQEAIENGGVNSVNVAVKGLLGEGSALTLQPDGSYALVASNGEKLTGLFANQDGVMRLQGSYIHLTGDTKIEGNVITNNMLAGSITADKLSVTSLSAITANLGTMTSISSDGLSATVISNSGGSVYSRASTSDSWTLRVRWGMW